MIERCSPETMEILKKEFLTGDNARVPLHLGNFLQWFGIAEVNLTTMLVYVLGLTDWEKLEYVVRGMDARVKCERLRQAAKAYRPLGENLKTALGTFEQDCIPLRNRIAHSWPVIDPDTEIIHFNAFSKMPSFTDDGQWEFEASVRNIHIDDLFSHAMWLNSFAGKLMKALQSSFAGGSLEIDDLP